MASLEELRGELDRLDEQIIALYERRMEVCSCVADYKIKNGRKVYDRQREQEKLAKAASQVEHAENKRVCRSFYPAHVTEQEASVSEAFTVRDDRETSVYRSRSVGSEKSKDRIPGCGGSLQRGGLKAVLWRCGQQLPCPYVEGCDGCDRGWGSGFCRASD